MGLFVKQQNRRSELQERIAADLQEKARQSALRDNATLDGVDDVKYLEGTKKTTSLAWAWLLVLLMVVGLFVIILMQGN